MVEDSDPVRGEGDPGYNRASYDEEILQGSREMRLESLYLRNSCNCRQGSEVKGI